MSSVPIPPLYSTPPKARIFTTSYTLASAEQGIRESVTEYRSYNIQVDDFLRIVFGLEAPNVFKNLENEVRAWRIDKTASFKMERERCQSRKTESDLYVPFRNIVRLIVDKALDSTANQSPLSCQHKIYAIDTANRPIQGQYGSRKPDMCLVPANVQYGDNSLRWHHVLAFVELKKGEKFLLRFKQEGSGLGAQPSAAGPATKETQGGEQLPDRRSKRALSHPEQDPISQLGGSTMREKKQRTVQINAEAAPPNLTIPSDPEGNMFTSSPSNAAPNPAPYVFVQAGNYAAEILSTRGDRRFALGIVLDGTKMTFCFFDRSGFTHTVPFDFVSDPTYLAIFLTMLVRKPLPELGFNDDTGYLDPFNPSNTETMKMKLKIETNDTKQLPFRLDTSKPITLGKMITGKYCLTGRGTALYEVKLAGVEVNAVAKISWQVETRMDEFKIIQKANEVDQKHTPEVYGFGTSKGHTLAAKLREACPEEFRARWLEQRELRVLFERRYSPITELQSPNDIINIILQLAECIHNLYSRGRILHRDISDGNVAYYMDENEYVAVLLDFDLAAIMDKDHRSPTSQYRSGTAPFMARDALKLEVRYLHTLRHDLESCFYLLIWLAMGYGGKIIPGKDHLRTWRKGDWSSILQAKLSFISDKFIRDQIFKWIPSETAQLRQLCEALWSIYCQELAQEASRNASEGTALSVARPPLAGFNLQTHDPSIPKFQITYAIWMWAAGKDVSPCNSDCCNANGQSR